MRADEPTSDFSSLKVVGTCTPVDVNSTWPDQLRIVAPAVIDRLGLGTARESGFNVLGTVGLEGDVGLG